MVVDPFTVVGGISAVVQILDAAIKTSRGAYGFFKSLKNAKDDVALLRRTLEETESLMGDLRNYLVEVQRSPSSTLFHHVSPESVVQIVQNFSADMGILRNVLPADFMQSISRKIEFVLGKKSLRDIVQRLEQRKSSAILVLDIIGRMGDIKLRDEVLSIHREVTSVAVGQSTLSGSLESKYQDIATRNQAAHDQQVQATESLRTSVEGLTLTQSTLTGSIEEKFNNIMTETRIIKESQTNNFVTINRLLEDSAHCVRVPKDNTESVALQYETASPRGSTTNMMPQSPSTIFVSRRVDVEDPDILGRIIRAELRQQLEPLTNHIEDIRGLIDPVAKVFSEQANLVRVSEQERPGPIISATRRSAGITSTVRHDDKPSHKDLELHPTGVDRVGFENHEVTLYTINHWMRSTLGDITVRVEAYRRRGGLVHDKAKYFRLRVLIVPRPWLFSRGLSIVYLTGPNVYGHYDICPSILSFRILDNSSPTHNTLMEVLVADDLPAFQKLLSQHIITLRDLTEHGENLLQLSVLFDALAMIQYLVRGTGFEGQRLVDDVVSCASLIGRIFLFRQLRNNLLQYRDGAASSRAIFQLLKELDLFDGGYEVSDYLWWTFRRMPLLSEKLLLSWREFDEEVIESMKVLREYDIPLHPPSLMDFEDKFTAYRQVEIYLRAGGDPNAVLGERSILLTALLLTKRLHGSKEDSEEREVCLLTPLIRAGADIYSIHYMDKDRQANTLTHQAIEWGCHDAWFNALQRCGLDFREVWEESCRRQDAYRRLRGASRSGVDEIHAADLLSFSGLRYRGRRSAIEDG